jgi:dihydrofolate reductase/thymidylate synthase
MRKILKIASQDPPGILVHSITDAHLYDEHIKTGLKFITNHKSIEQYEYNDIVIEVYYSCPLISFIMVA